MSRVSVRVGVITYAVLAALGLGAIVYAASNDARGLAFSLDIPPTAEVRIITPGQTACEGPIPTTAAFDAVQAFFVPAAVPGATFDLAVLDRRSGAILATGRQPADFTAQGARVIALSATVPVGRRVTVCLHSRGPRRVAVLGGSNIALPVIQTVEGRRTANVVALTFLRPRARSLLSLIPTVFDRASLFHPGWVGPWTFWLLTGAVPVAFVLGGVAVARGARADAGDDNR